MLAGDSSGTVPFSLLHRVFLSNDNKRFGALCRVVRHGLVALLPTHRRYWRRI